MKAINLLLCCLITLVALGLATPAAQDHIKTLVESFLKDKVEDIKATVQAETAKEWQQKFDDLKTETHTRLGKLEQNTKTRARRDLQDITALSAIQAAPQYVVSDGQKGKDFFPSTRAEDFLFFTLTPSNSLNVVSDIGQYQATFNACLVQAQSARCKDDECTSLTKNHVAQPVLSWDPFRQSWRQTGPGAAGSQDIENLLTSYRPVVANGVKGLEHFSPDGIHDFLIPASFDEDIGSSTSPTEQCTDVWLYAGLNSGWRKYQECAWKGHGTRAIKAFKINGEQYIVQANMVQRIYSSSNKNNLLLEHYNQSSFVFKWSQRTQDNLGEAYSAGFFLSGGENSDGEFSSSHPRYSKDFGNNGANVFQVLDGLTGAVDVEAFQIQDTTFIVFAEHISNTNCGPDGLGSSQSLTPSCQSVEVNSHIFAFDSTVSNPRGDCPSSSSNANLTGCQDFVGAFVPFQTLPTKGARSVHHFTVQVTGATHHFLAVAEHRDNHLNSVNSSIWKWNGREFGLFQRIDSNYATDITSFTVNGDVFLVVSNRGCPEIERESESASFARCDAQKTIGRARLWTYDPFKDAFVEFEESDTMGTLHAFGANFLDGATDADDALLGSSAVPHGVATYQLPTFQQSTGFGTPQPYVAIANHRLTRNDLVGACPDDDLNVCHFPRNVFSVSVDVSQGVSSQLSAVSQAATDNALYLVDLRTKLDGGQGLLGAFRNDPSLDLQTFSASASVSFQIDGTQYLAVASDEAYMTFEECLAMYTDELGPASECQYLSPQGLSSTAVATAQMCMQICNTTRPTTPLMKNRKTTTIIYKVGSAQKVVDESGRSRNIQAPRMVEVQRIPSLGVAHLHFFRQTTPATQGSYEACAKGLSTCYSEQAAAKQNFLLVSNRFSSCEQDLIRNRPNPRDPRRGVTTYLWDAKTLQFVQHQHIRGCQPVAAHPFTTACQATSASAENVPACNAYLAVEENCASDVQYAQSQGMATKNITMKITFHKWISASNLFVHCQPYEDVGDSRNRLESVCFQPADPHRSEIFVAPGDRHAFDFPDLLPASLVRGNDYTDDGTGYAPQLRGSNIAAIHFGVPRAQKDIFFVNTSSSSPISDADQEPRTVYYVNGRRRYEVVFSVVYDSASAPQVFALEALRPIDTVCGARHPITPRRRQFTLVQNLPLTDVSGGRAVTSFERTSLGGLSQTFFVFPELQYRSGAFVNPNFGSPISSVFTNVACDEFTERTFVEAVVQGLESWGILGPANDANLPAGDSKYCPYSLNKAHFDAWEAFYNHYNPVSPCKGRFASIDGSTATITQPYYNAVPPASLLNTGSTLAPRDHYVYPRSDDDQVTLNTHGYSSRDYQYLHDTRDNVLSKLQDLPTFGALSASVQTLCGGQLFLVFGQSGYDTITPPTSKRFFYVWNDRYAIDFRGECTALGARAAWEAANGNILNVRLGCFEFVPLTVPINNGAAVSVTMFQAADFFFAFHTHKFRTARATVDPGACANRLPVANRTLASVGVTSTFWTIDLSLNGGVQCRQDICCSSAPASGTQTPINNGTFNGTLSAEIINQLRSTFVDLTSDQVITGAKTFTSNLTQFSGVLVRQDLVVLGDVHATGELEASSIVTEGTVDGIDLSILQTQVLQVFYQQGWALANLEKRVCASADSTCQCVVVPLNTGCFPKPSLNSDGFAVLKNRFGAFVTANLAAQGLSANVSAVFAFPLQSQFLVTFQTCASNISAFNALSFFDECLCQDSPNAALRNTALLMEKTIVVHNASCDSFDLDHLERLRLAIADSLSQYGTRQADVFFTQTTCLSSSPRPRIRVSFKVSSHTTSQATISAELTTQATWKTVYDSFLLKLSSFSCVVANDLAIEYLPGLFIPEDGGSGSGVEI